MLDTVVTWQRLRLALLVAVLLVVGLGFVLNRGKAHTFAGTVIEQPQVVDSFELIRAGGETLRFPEAWRGKTVLAFFGYTQCPDVCPLTMAELAKVYRDLGEPDDLQVVMVTVDPAQDTPERVDRFATGFHPAFVGLGGDPSTLTKAAAAFYATSVPQDDGSVSHNSHVTVLDREGRMRVVYTQDNVPKMTEDLRYILRQNRW